MIEPNIPHTASQRWILVSTRTKLQSAIETVTGYVDQKKVLKAVRRTGRRAVLWPYQYSAEQHHTFNHQYHQHHPALAQAGVSGPSSSYNYYKHGYDDSRIHGYYQQPAMTGNRTGDIFSDENPNACSVM